MNEIFEVKRNRLFYEYNGRQCETVDYVRSFKGIVVIFDPDGLAIAEDVVTGFFDYNSNSYYWFYKDFESEFYLNKLNGFNGYKSSLDELEEAMNKDMDRSSTFKLTRVAHDYSLFIQRE